MSEFATNVNERVREARSALDSARAEGDEYLVGVHTGELESLARLAQENDVALPEGGSGSAEVDSTESTTAS
ncbi:hypothetical protein WDZ16_06795 [Pseudokineococcus marinus]|uniref:Uncharacterized protein n=1 Tax=Pseudokineococcus marinus TaxID=351215 RepID=A0A849C4B8_9ACTN|nr:hypothetical protein [Pseudokineococcus marinus]NNH24468.1 hypothetical protein [Pseudokineococcus marinus]